MPENGASVNRFLRRLRRSSGDRPLLDLVDERNVAACLYGARTGMVQASSIAPPVSYLPATFPDGSVSDVTRDLDLLADLAATPWNGDAA
jgi:hypothetical protein